MGMRIVCHFIQGFFFVLVYLCFTKFLKHFYQAGGNSIVILEVHI